MNNENNNLNGVVLGSVSNDTPIQNLDNSVVTPPVESQVIEPTQNPSSVVEPVVAPSPQPVEAAPTPNVVQPAGSEVVNPTMPSETVVTPTPVVSPEVSPTEPQTPVTPQPTPQSTQNVTPEPAYTSINSINPSPMPGFEGNIGTNPPISLEKEKGPKKKGNKTVFVLIIIVLLLGVAVGTYWVLNYTDLLTKKESITITTNNLIVDVGDELSTNIDDYATIKGTNSSNCTFSTENVDVTKEGIYKFFVTCSNNTKEGNITVVNNQELVIKPKTAYHVKGDTATAEEFVANVADDVNYSFADEDAVKEILNGEVGSYTVKILAKTEGGKEVSAEAKLVITQYKIKGYITCTSKEQTLENSVMEKSVKLAINDNKNSFANVGFEIYTFKYSQKDEYTKVSDEYKTNKKITINDIKGTENNVDFDKDNLTITITNEVDSTVLYSNYGVDNLKDYGAIRSYFINTLSYTCTYEKVND